MVKAMNGLKNLRDNKELLIPEVNETGIKGKIKITVLRLVAFLLVPLVEKQNVYNNEVCGEIETINYELKNVKPILEKTDFSVFTQYLERNDKMINSLEERIISLEKRIEELEAEKKYEAEK